MPDTNMNSMDARVLPDGTVVGRNDPRFYAVGNPNQPDDQWTQRVKSSMIGLQSNLSPLGSADGILPDSQPNKPTPVTSGVWNVNGLSRPGDNPDPNGPSTPAPPGTNPLGRPNAPNPPATAYPAGNNPTSAAQSPPANPFPNGDPQANVGLNSNPSAIDFMGGAAAIPGLQARFNSQAQFTPAQASAQGDIGGSWSPTPPASPNQPPPLKNGGRIKKRRPATITYKNGQRMSVTDGDEAGDQGPAAFYARGGRVSYANGGRASYADYEAAVLKNFADQGQTAKPGDYMSAAEWDKMSPKDQYSNMLMVAPAQAGPADHPANTQPAKYLGASDADAAAFKAKFGNASGPLVYSEGAPTNYGQGASAWANDPSRFLTLPDGRTVFEGSNVNPTWVAQQQSKDDDASNKFMENGALTIAGGALAGGLYGGFGDIGLESGAGGGVGGGAGGVADGAAAPATGAFDAEGVTPSLYGGDVAPAEGAVGSASTGGVDVSDPAVQQQMASNPAVQQQAAASGQSVTQWLSNPQNLLTAAKFVGGVLAATGKGSTGATGAQVPLVSGPGTPTAGVPVGTGAPGGPGGVNANYNATASQFQPITDLILSNAATAGGAADQEAAAGRAGATAAQQFAASRDATARNMVSQGQNPYAAGGPAAEANRLSTLDEARAAVGGENAARLAQRTYGDTMRTQAATLGTAREGVANTADNIGLQSQNNLANQDIARARANNEIATGNSNRNIVGRTAAGAGVNNLINTGSNLIDAIKRNNPVIPDTGKGDDGGGGMGDVIWNADGGRIDLSDVGLEVAKDMGKMRRGSRNYRDGARVARKERNYESGGDVRGPGTSTSDSIPARLSDGETVLNAEATELADAHHPGFLDELNKKGLMIRKVRERMRDIGLGA